MEFSGHDGDGVGHIGDNQGLVNAIRLLATLPSADPKPSPENASAVSDAPHVGGQVGSGGRAGRVRYSCLKEAAGEEAFMQIQWCCGDEKDSGNR